jgi:hypothetical protein
MSGDVVKKELDDLKKSTATVMDQDFFGPPTAPPAPGRPAPPTLQPKQQ